MKKIISLSLTVILLLVSLSASAAYVVTMYSPDGRTINIYNTEINAYKNVGWYEYPVDIIYSPDGRQAVVSMYEVSSYTNVGWYTYPVSYMYNNNGGYMVVANTDIQYWQARGWFLNSGYTSSSYYNGSLIPKYNSIADGTLVDNTTNNGRASYIYYTTQADTVNYIEYLNSIGWEILSFDDKNYETGATGEFYNIIMYKDGITLLIIYSVESDLVSISYKL